jgi:hypothetical protein
VFFRCPCQDAINKKVSEELVNEDLISELVRHIVGPELL